MSTKQALPIFSTSKVDTNSTELFRRNRIALRKSPEVKNSPVSCRSNKKDLQISTPIKNKSKSTSNIFNCNTPSHTCSPSLSPKSTRRYKATPIRRFYSDNTLDDSASFNDASDMQVEETSNFVVGVRVRPFNQRESSDKLVRNVVSISENEVQLTCTSGTIHTFSYDHCLWSFDEPHECYASQKLVFETMVNPLLEQLLLGYNACLLAYGQTGSGKSYSMMGIPGTGSIPGEESGVIPRFCYELFNRLGPLKEGSRVEISYYEIYNEKIHDLLAGHASHNNKTPLKVREHPDFGPYIVDLAVHGVNSYDDVKDWLTVGNSQRVTAATGMNEKSSRSHSIFSILLTQQSSEGITCRSRINLVDLAGSERVAQTCATGAKLKEGVSINKSLLSLGKVITFLSEKSRRRGAISFAPYRESVLTWLLRESLGGNSQTAMLATVSPANIHLDETLATLRYACQARSIVNRVHKNEDPNERLIRELQAKMAKITVLRDELERVKSAATNGDSLSKKDAEISELKRKLQEAEEKVQRDQLSWEEKLKSAEDRKSAELQHLKQCGVAVELNLTAKQSCLINLSEDPILTGTLFYLLPPGKIIVGRSSDCDIVLNGPLVMDKHCEIKNDDNHLHLYTLDDGGETYLNGIAITDDSSVELKQGDRLVLGGIHFFRVHTGEGGSQGTVCQQTPADFEFARSELEEIQEARLRAELDAALHEAAEERSQHARQLKNVMDVLEAQTDVLESERRVKRELEIERDVLQARVNEQQNLIDTEIKISPYKSNFLKELEDIFSPYEWKYSLHEMHLKVREATRRCADLGFKIEFQQEQIMDKNGLEPSIKVTDLTRQLSTRWKPSTFLTFFNSLRENENKEFVENSINDYTISWEKDLAKKKGNTRRISLNTKLLKENIQPVGNIQNQIDEMKKLGEHLLSNLQCDSPAYQEALDNYKHFLEVLQNAQMKSVRFRIS